MRISALPLIFFALISGAVLSEEPESLASVVKHVQPDATLTLKGGSSAVGIGYTWGNGDLICGRASHKFVISGVSIIETGERNITASGAVYNLKALADFSGIYLAASAGTVVKGPDTAIFLKNEHGVVIKLVAMDADLKWQVSADGLFIVLRGEPRRLDEVAVPEGVPFSRIRGNSCNVSS